MRFKFSTIILIKLIFLITQCINIIAYDAASKVGVHCIVTKTGTPGVCDFQKNCRQVEEDLKKGRYPTICGFANRQQIVCCPNRKVTQNVRISTKKCIEYKNQVSERQFLQIDNTIEYVCALQSKTLVSGGEEAAPREFPHMALIGFVSENRNDIKWGCGGSLISDQFILTAAHCVSSSQIGTARYARLGGTSDIDRQTILVTIKEAFQHPDYKYPSIYNDIALFRLTKKVIFNDYVRPACLHSGNIKTRDDTIIATGWGQLSEDNQATSDTLMKVTLESFTHEDCFYSYDDQGPQHRQGILNDTQLCAGSYTTNRDTCPGDSGGPLQIYNRLRNRCVYEIIGVTSFGRQCGTSGTPGVYTRVYAYLSWIEGIVWPGE